MRLSCSIGECGYLERLACNSGPSRHDYNSRRHGRLGWNGRDRGNDDEELHLDWIIKLPFLGVIYCRCCGAPLVLFQK